MRVRIDIKFKFRISVEFMVSFRVRVILRIR